MMECADATSAVTTNVATGKMSPHTFVEKHLTLNNKKLLDIPLSEYVSTHPHLSDGVRDLHHTCLRIVNVEGIPVDIRPQLKKRLNTCVSRYYYQPHETWCYIWTDVAETLQTLLPHGPGPIPAYAMQISEIMRETF